MLDEALKREVVVMGAGRKVELGRRMGLLDVLREVEEGVIVSASREPVMALGSDGRGVWGGGADCDGFGGCGAGGGCGGGAAGGGVVGGGGGADWWGGWEAGVIRGMWHVARGTKRKSQRRGAEWQRDAES